MKKTRLLLTFLITCLFVPALWADEGQGTFETREVLNIVYKTIGDEELKLNLFLPVQDDKQPENLPLLIWLDSGCWYSNGPGNGGYWRALGGVERGYAVASVGHRSLGAGSIFPDQIEDVRAAVRFLRAHAAEYGLDPNRFASMGASSGGHLSTMLGIADSYEIFDVGENLDQSGQVQCVVDFYGPTRFGDAIYSKLSIDCLYEILGAKKIEGHRMIEQADQLVDTAEKYSSYNYVDENYAPTLILQGGEDKIVLASQSFLLFDKLRANDVRTKLFYKDTGVHDINSLGTPEELGAIIFEFLGWE
ncbi:MAG: alpha/beta hydrolase [Thermoguttaceae bacterium]|nr:alpha/beta hydrolase [Thermoguttaceae bacterium]